MKKKHTLLKRLKEDLDECCDSNWSSIDGEDGLGQIIFYSLLGHLGLFDCEERKFEDNKTSLSTFPSLLNGVEEYVIRTKGVPDFDIREVLYWDKDVIDLSRPSGCEVKDKKKEYDRQNYLKKKQLNGTQLQKLRNEQKDKKKEYDRQNYLKKKLKGTK
jgi:hypothetical protein